MVLILCHRDGQRFVQQPVLHLEDSVEKTQRHVQNIKRQDKITSMKLSERYFF